MKRTAGAALLAASTILAACGGGGGSAGLPAGGPPATLSPTLPPVQTPAATVAQGTLVDDPSGTPLAGIPVRLDPWIAYPTPGPTPTPVALSTTDPSGHFTIAAPNGTYMLVIGPDAVNTPPPGWTTPAPSATDTPIPGASGWRATIHDQLVLRGQTTLIAPTMPPQPLYTPPAAETNGAYRLATIDALTEAPCLLAYNQDRTSLNLPAAVTDEWLQENVRAIRHSVETWNAQNPNGGDVVQFLSSGAATSSVSGGANCARLVGPNNSGNFSAPSQALSAEASSFGGTVGWYTAPAPYGSQSDGYVEFPWDPRVIAQSIAPPWP